MKWHKFDEKKPPLDEVCVGFFTTRDYSYAMLFYWDGDWCYPAEDSDYQKMPAPVCWTTLPDV